MKMKACVAMLLACLVVLTLAPIQASAAQTGEREIVYFEDGSYLETITAGGNTRTIVPISGSRTYTYYSSDDVKQWAATLNGTFIYTGTTAVCTVSDCSVAIYDDSWYVESKTAERNGATATATVVMGYKVLGITVSKKTCNLILSCDKDGNLS